MEQDMETLLQLGDFIKELKRKKLQLIINQKKSLRTR